MQVFLSYSSSDRAVAEEIQLALLGEGHEVFFDQDSLPAGGNYHARIHSAIALADAIVFLISPQSIAPGSYALTELKLARSRWRHPKGKVLPVRLGATPWNLIPAYLKSVTVLEPAGNVAAEVAAAVAALPSGQALSFARSGAAGGTAGDGGTSGGNGTKVQIWIAAMGLVGVLGAAAIPHWLQKREKAEVVVLPGTGGLKGPDATTTDSPDLNTQCPEITVMDYSKHPPESSIVRRCPPNPGGSP